MRKLGYLRVSVSEFLHDLREVRGDGVFEDGRLQCDS